jgi:hypothetical protein
MLTAGTPVLGATPALGSSTVPPGSATATTAAAAAAAAARRQPEARRFAKKADFDRVELALTARAAALRVELYTTEWAPLARAEIAGVDGTCTFPSPVWG